MLGAPVADRATLAQRVCDAWLRCHSGSWLHACVALHALFIGSFADSALGLWSLQVPPRPGICGLTSWAALVSIGVTGRAPSRPPSEYCRLHEKFNPTRKPSAGKKIHDRTREEQRKQTLHKGQQPAPAPRDRGAAGRRCRTDKGLTPGQAGWTRPQPAAPCFMADFGTEKKA